MSKIIKVIFIFLMLILLFLAYNYFSCFFISGSHADILQTVFSEKILRSDMKYTLPELPYAYSALEPYMDARTVEIHYTKHHQAYVDNLNKALEGHIDLQAKPLLYLLTHPDELPGGIRDAVINNGGGHYAHTFFWTIMSQEKQLPSKKMLDLIIKSFGSFDNFKKEFSDAAKTLFGSGWTWLCVNQKGELVVVKTHGHGIPQVSGGLQPVLVLDVWEHAYYLKYQNRRSEFIEAWWNLINWSQVEQNYYQVFKK
ncbi:MAG: Superoxide dismutase [candidate division TM6 bacterium GW2011_GWF2_32_72]|nr:MAG: Superoxide dismutase [candidate division TM6 bacterium GW2011_GWF2_32_72]